MNTLVIKNKFEKYFNNAINEVLKETGIMLITKTNVYKSYDHVISTSLNPQYKTIDDINLFIEEKNVNLIFDIWDQKINEISGQDIDSLLLATLGSFINSKNSKKTLIIDCFHELSEPIKKRIVEIQGKSNLYGVDTFICIQPDQEKYTDVLIMNAHQFYLPKIPLSIKTNVTSVLSQDELVVLDALEDYEILFKSLASGITKRLKVE